MHVFLLFEAETRLAFGNRTKVVRIFLQFAVVAFFSYPKQKEEMTFWSANFGICIRSFHAKLV